ncbi:nitrogen fixation protein NifU [Aneurinibacillus migulanus]|uniref:Nitrogen fixation protein NifU n=1 Tax=Aneurinibacillus migulanus TaxID=47500 RepID=A0A0D1WG82_ANEMI|nr:SUF system NifU family Fe-S cluster assembly protein [Aneurinibacillus migulanus]KIV57540.1 nitrogen fixation protein NifU [Aneurinibacillus migulanus]KIV60002.1 nitrogen fixation protein NifU [Aneurinibacillus migulanus]KON94840.1 nitrogen fixation protein NifU [Aneurinibacillus migulanus]KPD07201.1 nitrogen fixation protein NifU [Aneurinibacillus migulanus]MCP1354785.1 SUF system NifU family Fe-S cluster assembly protein [Aneurinibacillus migulanus]
MSSLDDLYRRVIMDHYQKPRNRGELEDGALTVNMNNPTCGDRIQLQMKVEDGKVTDARFTGEGCSISMSSASMMTEAVKGLEVDEALARADLFSRMMKGEASEEEIEEADLGDIEALQGVSKFPARIKCATLAWKAMEKGLRE